MTAERMTRLPIPGDRLRFALSWTSLCPILTWVISVLASNRRGHYSPRLMANELRRVHILSIIEHLGSSAEQQQPGLMRAGANERWVIYFTP